MYLALLFASGLAIYVSSQSEIQLSYIQFVLFISINSILAIFGAIIMSNLKMFTKITKIITHLFSIIYVCIIIDVMVKHGLTISKSAMLIISIMLLTQATSANFDPILINKWKTSIFDICTILISIIILVHGFKYCRLMTYYTISTMLLFFIFITSIFLHRTLFFVSINILAYPPINPEILLLKSLIVMVLLTYAHGYTSTITEHNNISTLLIPNYDLKSMMSLILITVVATIFLTIIYDSTILIAIYFIVMAISVFCYAIAEFLKRMPFIAVFCSK